MVAVPVYSPVRDIPAIPAGIAKDSYRPNLQSRPVLTETDRNWVVAVPVYSPVRDIPAIPAGTERY